MLGEQQTCRDGPPLRFRPAGSTRYPQPLRGDILLLAELAASRRFIFREHDPGAVAGFASARTLLAFPCGLFATGLHGSGPVHLVAGLAPCVCRRPPIGYRRVSLPRCSTVSVYRFATGAAPTPRDRVDERLYTLEAAGEGRHEGPLMAQSRVGSAPPTPARADNHAPASVAASDSLDSELATALFDMQLELSPRGSSARSLAACGGRTGSGASAGAAKLSSSAISRLLVGCGEDGEEGEPPEGGRLQVQARERDARTERTVPGVLAPQHTKALSAVSHASVA
jgi:hypothetical protein